MTDLTNLAVTTFDDAHAELTANDRTLDAMADDLLKRMALFMGECVQEENFCGIAIDAKRDSNGKILQLRFTPCDDVSGVPVRRFERDDLPKVVVK